MCDILRYAQADWKALISSRGRPPVIVPLWPPSRLSEMRPSLTPVRAFFSANRNPVILECQPLLASPLTPRMIPCVCVRVLLFFFSLSRLSSIVRNIVCIPATQPPRLNQRPPVSGCVAACAACTSISGSKYVGGSDIFEVCGNCGASRSKFPEVLGGLQRQRLFFFFFYCQLGAQDI